MEYGLSAFLAASPCSQAGTTSSRVKSSPTTNSFPPTSESLSTKTHPHTKCSAANATSPSPMEARLPIHSSPRNPLPLYRPRSRNGGQEEKRQIILAEKRGTRALRGVSQTQNHLGRRSSPSRGRGTQRPRRREGSILGWTRCL